MTADSLELADALGIERVLALGWFDGARRAVRRALQRPEQTVGVDGAGGAMFLTRTDDVVAAVREFLRSLEREGARVWG